MNYRNFVFVMVALALLSAIVPAFANVGHEVCQSAAVPQAGVPVTRTTNGDYDVVTERSSRVPALECRIAALEAQRRHAARHGNSAAIRRLSHQISALRSGLANERVERIASDQRLSKALGFEASTRAVADEALSNRIIGEAQSRRTGDQDIVTFVTVLIALVILAFGGYMILNR